MMFLSHKKSAFTLIELLIVVAIIAILAAIAVPNFMEAQTRSKVARVKSDMRTLATALEAYYVDHNNYVMSCGNDKARVGGYGPNGFAGYTTAVGATVQDRTGGPLNGTMVDVKFGGFFHMLSSPVSYIANGYFKSPFTPVKSHARGDLGYEEENLDSMRYYAFNKAQIVAWSMMNRPDWAGRPREYRYGLPCETNSVFGQYSADVDPQITWWCLMDPGPDLQTGGLIARPDNGSIEYWDVQISANMVFAMPLNKFLDGTEPDGDAFVAACSQLIYDPTNGTRSTGNIFRLGGSRPKYSMTQTAPLDEPGFTVIGDAFSGGYRFYYALAATQD